MKSALRQSAAHVFVESLVAPELSAADSHHLVRVLRLRDGEQVSAADGKGSWVLCRLHGGLLVPEAAPVTDHAEREELTIAVVVPKQDRPEWLVQKLTEIGADRIVLLRSERSVVRWDAERSARHVQKLRTVAREAAMQSRRVRLPEINGQHDLLTFLDARDGERTVAAAEPDGEQLDASVHTVLIGPEGGWTSEEITLIGRTVTLGSNILRVETAALVAATQMVALRHGRW